MDTKTVPFVPYYAEMENILIRLKELDKMGYPHYRTTYLPEGGAVTAEVPEYLEEQSLIARWNSLQEYERALDCNFCKNRLLVSLRLDTLSCSHKSEMYDPAVAYCIAISVYRNQSIN